MPRVKGLLAMENKCPIYRIYCRMPQNVYLKGLIASTKGCALIFQVIDAILTIERQTYEAVCQLLGFEGPNWAKWGFLQPYSMCECTKVHCCMDHESASHKFQVDFQSHNYWLCSRCDELCLNGSKKSSTEVQDSYTHAQKMCASMTYAFGCIHGLGSLPWHDSESTHRMVQNSSMSGTVSSYMISLWRRKVGSSPNWTFQLNSNVNIMT